MKALLLRDLRLSIRAGGGFGLGLAFFLILILLVAFGLGPNPALLSQAAAGLLWLGALLACLLSLDRIFALDFEDGSLDLLATAPIPLEAVAAVKALAHWLTTGLPLAFIAPPAWFDVGSAGCRVSLVDGLFAAGHARAQYHWHLWRSIDRRVETRRAALVTFGFTALRPDVDFWRRGGAARGRGPSACHAGAAARGYFVGLDGIITDRGGGVFAYQSALIASCLSAVCHAVLRGQAARQAWKARQALQARLTCLT